MRRRDRRGAADLGTTGAGAAGRGKGRKTTPPVRLTRRGRVVLVVAVALLSLGGFWLGTRAAGHAEVRVVVTGHAGLPWVEVHKGDTLWKIADALAEGDDPGPVVEEIKRLNGLPDSFVRSGSRLYVPANTAALR